VLREHPRYLTMLAKAEARLAANARQQAMGVT
jgi:hypothetical protein